MSILAKVRSSRALQAVSRFYSASGLTSIPRMVLVTVAVVAILWVCGQPDWTMGLPINTLAGAVAGAALAKLIVEAVRRLRDAGISLRVAAWCALAVGIWVFITIGESISSISRWVDVSLNAIRYGTPALAAVALLWPPRRRPQATSDEAQRPAADRIGPRFALICILCVTGIMLFDTWFSIGMDESNKRAMRYVAAHPHEGE